jgi:hypothetical protein
MIHKYKITYTVVGKKEKEVVIEATSKYDAKQKFYRIHPKCVYNFQRHVVRIEEVEE